MKHFPEIRTAGVDGFLVRFGDTLSEPANRAALAFRAAVENEGWVGVEETSPTLVSAYVRFDVTRFDHAVLGAQLQTLLDSRDWFSAPLPIGRRLWRIPTVYGGTYGPQLDEAAALAGMDGQAAIADLSSARVRVQAIGFSPGQPYLGPLPAAWDIPRQTALTPQVPRGALVVAIRQFVLFGVDAPTGWRHLGQTAVTLFRPDAADPFMLRPGDEVMFPAVAPDQLEQMRADPMGGAVAQVLP